MKRNRNRLSGIGMIALAFVAAMGLMGVGYAAWTDKVTINATVQMGTAGTQLMNGLSWTTNPSGVPVSAIISGNEIAITLTPQTGTHYYTYFCIYNTGSLPVKIENIGISGLPVGAVCDPGAAVGDTIEPGGVRLGTVHIYNTTTGSPITVTITFGFSIWNN